MAVKKFASVVFGLCVLLSGCSSGSGTTERDGGDFPSEAYEKQPIAEAFARYLSQGEELPSVLERAERDEVAARFGEEICADITADGYQYEPCIVYYIATHAYEGEETVFPVVYAVKPLTAYGVSVNYTDMTLSEYVWSATEIRSYHFSEEELIAVSNMVAVRIEKSAFVGFPYETGGTVGGTVWQTQIGAWFGNAAVAYQTGAPFASDMRIRTMTVADGDFEIAEFMIG